MFSTAVAMVDHAKAGITNGIAVCGYRVIGSNLDVSDLRLTSRVLRRGVKSSHVKEQFEAAAPRRHLQHLIAARRASGLA
jgi:hypothetical protein